MCCNRVTVDLSNPHGIWGQRGSVEVFRVGYWHYFDCYLYCHLVANCEYIHNQLGTYDISAAARGGMLEILCDDILGF